jgi:outer membrane receptor protein involved in Fe transport
VSWSEGANQLRLLVEREVGQLDFEDFASSASLSTGTVTAGNPDLEPDQTWRMELAWEHRVLDGGAVTITARHEEIDDLIDRIPVFGAEVFDAIGNIGEGERSELELAATLPLDSIGLSAGVIKAAVLWRDSEATDPVTGESRIISEDVPREASLHLSQALPQWRARWGLDVAFATQEREYHFDEVRTDSLDNALSVFVEYEPVPAWNVRLFASNLTDRPAIRRREVYDGMRSEAPLGYIETRTLKIGPYAGIQVRRQFGE